MIFAVTGTQLPFDRLIRMLDELAPLIGEEIVAQVGNGGYSPQHIKTLSFLAPDEFDRLFSQARLIVAHAGMGTILTALTLQKPIIIFPRIAALGEHRNEHQTATADEMRKQGWCYVATGPEELKSLLLSGDLHPLRTIGPRASDSLIRSITEFVEK